MQRRETMNANEEAVGAVMAKYQKALNESDTDAVMKLYASDGVFMPQNSPSQHWLRCRSQGV
jgi:ketosteroid isomerase-like protein